MISKEYNYNMINWSKFINNYKKIALNNNKQIKINNNIYILLLLLFKYFILKDMYIVNYKYILKIFNSNIFNNLSEFRLYYLFYYVIIEHDLIKFLWYIHILLIEKQIDYTIKNTYNYYHSNYMYFAIYLLSKKENYLLHYSKYDYYNNHKLLKKIFLYKEFILKVDYTTIHIYMKYIEYFRKTKYNEYITNNKLLWNYPKLKELLVIKINKNILSQKTKYRAAILLKFFNIYHIISNYNLNIDKNILTKEKNLINNSIDNYNEYNKSQILYKKFSLFKFKNLKIDNEYLIAKITNLNIFKFLNLINPFSYFKFLKIFKNILTIYIIFITHEIYNRYILLSKKLRKIKFRHLISIHYKYQSIQFKFISYIYKYYYINYYNNLFSKPSLINYGFLSYYYLENNIYIINYIKKNILLYRILNIFIVKHINIKFHNFFNYIDVEAHKANSFKNPALQKMWNINYIKNWKYKSPIHAPLYSNIFEGFNRIHNIISYNKNMPIPKNYYITQINWNFVSYWKTIIRWSFIKFYTILNNLSNDIEVYKIIYFYKYTLEFIFWEIINSNNNKYNNYKYFLGFNMLSKNIKITNIINIYLNKYFNEIIKYFINYSKDHLINISFCYYLFNDLFINIYSFNINDSIINNQIEKLIKKNLYIMDKYKKNYSNFFLWQIKNYCSLLRFRNFYFKYEHKYYMEYYIPIAYPWETNYKLWLEKLHDRWKNK